MSAPYSRTAVVSLYRKMLKDASKFANYNFREHAHRRIAWEFKSNRHITSAEAEAKYTWGLGQADIVRRQAVISQLYPEQNSVAATHRKARC